MRRTDSRAIQAQGGQASDLGSQIRRNPPVSELPPADTAGPLAQPAITSNAVSMDGTALRAYRETMPFGSLRRRALALIAAYAIALQPLWAAFALPAVAGLTDAHAVICLGGGGQDRPATDGGTCACPCVMPGCGMTGCDPGVVAGAPWPSPSGLSPLPVPERPPPPAATHGPRLPRAPPIA
jgi:hypothetical protein